MSNFGFFRLSLVNPFEPSFLEARSAVGAAELLANAKVFATVGEAVADCTLVVGTTAVGRREIRQPLKFLEEGGLAIHKHLRSRSAAKNKKKNEVAILFGSEKFGLSNEDLSHCNWLLRIPTRDEHRSMNLGQAVSMDSRSAATVGQKLRRLMRRHALTAEDAKFWMGMFGQITYKLRQEKKG